ncbi:MAG: ferrous iron transport protein B [Acidobacteriota bacterium]|nr:ferrous iron transport protein B [Acidobacteriota bacterium]
MSTTVETTMRAPAPSAIPEREAVLLPLTIALAGNPNAGKTSLFNALTGLRQKVANYPGVTVERKEGVWSLASDLPPARLIDLPGLYSLDASAIDEQIARDILTGKNTVVPAPDVIVAVVDATNLERNLYLVTQLMETKRPLVIALTMMDLATRSGLKIDIEKLRGGLGVPVVPVGAKQRRGLEDLARQVLKAVGGESPLASWQLSDHAERELRALAVNGSNQTLTARESALGDLYAEELPANPQRRAAVAAARERLAGAVPNWWQEPVLARYQWIEQVARRAVIEGDRDRPDVTDRIDRVVTHRVFGPVLLLVVMLLIFQTIFSWATVPMDLIDGSFGALQEWTRGRLPDGLLASLVADGIIAGVGGVLVFLPQILLLFFFISLLEDSGYMARAAFLTDRLMRGVGLHGKAFMPLLSSFACAIPGIMATRTIENPKDRLATMMIAPFMSCSARLPVYTLMIAAFFTERKILGVLSIGVLIIMSMYLLGIAVAVIAAWVLKHTILKGPPPPLVLELPPYRVPNFMNIAQTMQSRAWIFIKRAGTVIMAISILLWALVTFPRQPGPQVSPGTAGAVAQVVRETGVEARGEPAPGTNPASSNEAGELDAAGAQLRNSFAGRAGRLIEPLIAPLGFDWKMGIGLIASFAARETLVSTLSIVYNVGADAREESSSLIDAVRNARRPDGSPAWTPLVAVSMMVFFVLACQCMSTIAVVRRETNSWRWPLFMVGYMLVLAYVASFITFQGGRLLGFS